jgi:hypothetical protein
MTLPDTVEQQLASSTNHHQNSGGFFIGKNVLDSILRHDIS